MSATLKAARDLVRDRWEATTPPTDATVTYRRLRSLERSGGVMSRRMFYFGAPRGGKQTEWGYNFTVVRTEFEGVVRIDLTGRTFDDLFDNVADEATLLMGRVNLVDGLPAGVRMLRATDYRVEPAGDALNLIITITAETEESDGSLG